MRNFIKYFAFLLIIGGCASLKNQPQVSFIPCSEDLKKYQSRSEELQKIVQLDQKDRTGNIDWKSLPQKDEAHRKRVAEIFAEGCLKTSQDYSAAALVFQHGVVPEHFYQTFLWSKKAVELGDTSQKRLAALGIDRYLVKSGHKQLFGSQASKENPESCWCMDQVEASFPVKLKLEWAGQTRKQDEDWLKSLNKDQPQCSQVIYCDKKLKPTPQKTIPGFW